MDRGAQQGGRDYGNSVRTSAREGRVLLGYVHEISNRNRGVKDRVRADLRCRGLYLQRRLVLVAFGVDDVVGFP